MPAFVVLASITIPALGSYRNVIAGTNRFTGSISVILKAEKAAQR
jgi:hypothetical protein